MANEDLQHLDKRDWAQHLKWNSYSKLVVRLVLGAAMLCIPFLAAGTATFSRSRPIPIISLIFGAVLLVVGVRRFFRDRVKRAELE